MIILSIDFYDIEIHFFADFSADFSEIVNMLRKENFFAVFCYEDQM